MQTQLLMVRMQTTHNTDTATDGASTNHPEHTHNYGWCIYKSLTAQIQLQMACLQTTQSTPTTTDGVYTNHPQHRHNYRWRVYKPPHRDKLPKAQTQWQMVCTQPETNQHMVHTEKDLPSVTRDITHFGIPARQGIPLA